MEDIIADILSHIEVLNDDYTQLSVDVAILKNDVATLMWWFKAFMGAFIILGVSQFWQIFILKKNGKKKEV